MGGNDGLVVLYVLAPITVTFAIAVIAYITIQQRRLTQRMLESGKFYYATAFQILY